MKNEQNPLKKWLHANGIKVSWFAAQIGVASQTLSAHMSGKRPPTRKTLLAIQAATNGEVTPDQWGQI